MKILFVLNPKSGKGNIEKSKVFIEETFEKQDVEFDFFLIGPKHGNKELFAKVKEENFDTIVIGGGDGTINSIIKTLIDETITFGILPLGSANGMAEELDIPEDFEEDLNIIIKRKTRQIDVLRINDKNYSVHLSDLGLNARVIKQFEKRNVRGIWGYFIHYLKELKQVEYQRYIIEVNGYRLKKKASMIVIANARKYGTGAVINNTGKIDDGLFELIIIKPFNYLKMLKMIWRFFRANTHKMENIEVIRSRKATIYNLERQPLQIDGEIIGHPPVVKIELLPNQIEVIVP